VRHDAIGLSCWTDRGDHPDRDGQPDWRDRAAAPAPVTGASAADGAEHERADDETTTATAAMCHQRCNPPPPDTSTNTASPVSLTVAIGLPLSLFDERELARERVDRRRRERHLEVVRAAAGNVDGGWVEELPTLESP